MPRDAPVLRFETDPESYPGLAATNIIKNPASFAALAAEVEVLPKYTASLSVKMRLSKKKVNHANKAIKRHPLCCVWLHRPATLSYNSTGPEACL